MALQSFRIITFNTWKGDGNYSSRLLKMISQLQELKPDILCLQESLQSETHDTAKALAVPLAMNTVFAPGRFKEREIEGELVKSYSGLAILTRHELISNRIYSLPGHELDPDRIALAVQLMIDNTPLTITNIHLTHIAGEKKLRLSQFFTMAEKIKDELSPGNWLCCGDFNMELDQQTLKNLGDGTDRKLTDCYLEGGGALPGKTMNGKRLDYILCLSRKNAQNMTCRNSRLVLNKDNNDDIYPSDHFGVQTDIFFHNE